MMNLLCSSQRAPYFAYFAAYGKEFELRSRGMFLIGRAMEVNRPCPCVSRHRVILDDSPGTRGFRSIP